MATPASYSTWTVLPHGPLEALEDNLWRVEAGLSAAVTETITLSAAAGFESSTAAGGTLSGTSDFYGTAGLAWAPGGGFTSSSSLTVNSLGGYKAVFKAAKSIK